MQFLYFITLSHTINILKAQTKKMKHCFHAEIYALVQNLILTYSSTKFTQHLDSSKNALMNAIKKIAGLGPI